MRNLHMNRSISKMASLLAGTALVCSVPCGAHAQTLPESGSEAAAPNDRSTSSEVGEIIVTATKREQSIQDVPMSITALTADEIDKRGFVSMDDYLRVLPSVNMISAGEARKSSIIVRGIAASPPFEEDSVGTYFGEIPLSSLSALAGDWHGSPDIKLVDVERVELLRGPQGTLYGSGSMGGTVRVIPAAPDTGEFQANVTLGYSNTAKYGSDNNVAKAMVNIPVVNDHLALRAVAYRFKNSGFVRNVAASTDNVGGTAAAGRANGAVVIDERGIGENTYTGGRVALAWTPTDSFKAVFTLLRQNVEEVGDPNVDTDVGGYKQVKVQLSPEVNKLFPSRGLQNKAAIENLVLTYDLGWGEIFSSSSHMNSKSTFKRDITPLIGPLDQGASSDVDVFVEEVRLSSAFDGPFQFLLGAYYEDKDIDTRSANFWSGDPALNPIPSGDIFDPPLLSNQILAAHNTRKIEQKAAFGEVSYEIADNLTLTAGARIFEYDRKATETTYGPALGIDTEDKLSASESGETYKASVSYEPSKGVHLYALWSQGFRLGRPLPKISPFCDPDGDGLLTTVGGQKIKPADQINSDNLDNYEVGGKFSFFQRRLNVNVAVYQIDWNGIPVSVPTLEGCSLSINAGTARSRGIELETEARLTDALSAQFGMSYVKAELTSDAGGLGVAGDRLPGSPKFNANAALEYAFDLRDHPAFIRADWAYVGGYHADVAQLLEKAGDYHQANLRAGVNIDSVDLEVYVNNVTNSDALTFATIGGQGGLIGYRIRPRTIGVQLSWTY